jgi:hypothetical protein
MGCPDPYDSPEDMKMKKINEFIYYNFYFKMSCNEFHKRILDTIESDPEYLVIIDVGLYKLALYKQFMAKNTYKCVLHENFFLS